MKLKLYTAQGVDAPRGPALIDLDDAGAPYKAAAGALAGVSDTANKLGGLAADALQRENAAKAEVESENALTQYERALVDEDIKLQRDPKFDFTTHDATLDEKGKGLIEKYAGALKTELGAAAFRKKAARVLKEKVINAKYASKARLDEAAEGANIDANNRMANKVADADPALRDAMLEAQKVENADWGQRYNKVKEAEARTRKLYEDVDTILARRSMKADPDNFLVELDDAEMYKHLDATKRQQLFEQATKLAEVRAKNADLIKAQHSGAIKKHLIDRMDGVNGAPGLNVDAEIRALRGSLTDEDYEHLIERNKKTNGIGADVETDRDTYFTLELGIREGRVTSHRQIDMWKAKLSISDYRTLGNILDEKIRPSSSRKTEAERARDKQIEAGETLLKGIFKVAGGLMGDFEQETNAATTLALAEFQSRIATEKDKHPVALANEIMMQHAKGLRDKLERDPQRISVILKYRDEGALKAARGSMSTEAYLANKRLLDYWRYLGGVASGKGVDAMDAGAAGKTPGASGDKPAGESGEKPATSNKQPTSSQGRKPFPGSFGINR